jgi:hypothetical protein
MEDQTAAIIRLRRQIETFRYSLESLGAAERLTQRGRIADAERQVRRLLAGADVTAAATQIA